MTTTKVHVEPTSSQAKQVQEAQSEIKAKLNSLFSSVKEIKPPYGQGKSESWWTVFSGKDIFEARRNAGTYAVNKQESDTTTQNVRSTLLKAASGAGRFSMVIDAVDDAYDTVWTGPTNYGYEETIALKAMLIVVEDLSFNGKQKCIDIIDERMKAIKNGFIPFASVGAELVVYKISPPIKG